MPLRRAGFGSPERVNHSSERTTKPARGARDVPAPRSVTVRVSLAISRRGGRKLVLTPDGSRLLAPSISKVDTTIVKALARAHRWKAMIESGTYGSLTELAGAEKINQSYLGRVLRLTLLAPDIAEAILAGGQPLSSQLDRFLRPIPIDWDQQRREFKSD